jgi:hypothetical protein
LWLLEFISWHVIMGPSNFFISLKPAHKFITLNPW